jgi:hypothetical protein
MIVTMSPARNSIPYSWLPSRWVGGGGARLVRLGCIGTFAEVLDSAGDLFFHRFRFPYFLGQDRIPAPAGRAEGPAGRDRNLVLSQEAGKPKAVENQVRGAVSDCWTGPHTTSVRQLGGGWGGRVS